MHHSINIMSAVTQQKKSLHLNFAAVAIVASGAAVVFALVIVPFLTTTAQEPQNGERRIVALDSRYDYKAGEMITKVDYVKVGDMQSNTAFWFLDPFGKTMEGNSAASDKLKPGNTLNQEDWDVVRQSEPFEFYTIIRLPAWLGGSKDDLSAYRAYSAVAISDQCLSRYWGTDGRWRIENPCAGDLYRPWDGMATGGPAAVGITGRGIITSGYFNGLASLDLSVDNEGYITAKKPNRDYSANGVAGEGRRFTAEVMRKSGEEMIRAASQYAGYSLPFPASISSAHYLADLRPTNEPWSLQYPDYEVPLVLEAAYYTSPSGGDTGYGEVIIRSYRLDVFPELSLDSSKMATERIDMSSPDNDNSQQHAKLNQTTVNSLIHLDWHDNANSRPWAVKSGTDIAGNFSFFVAPTTIEDGNEVLGAGALIWGTSLDGKDMLVTIRASSMDMDELIALGKDLPMR